MNKKKLAMFGLPILAIALVSATYLVLTLNSDVTVNEAFTIATTDASFSAFTGGVYCSQVNIHNNANVPIDAQLTFVPSNNGGVSYITSPVIETIPAESDASPEVCITVANDSPAGIVDGSVTIERLA